MHKTTQHVLVPNIGLLGYGKNNKIILLDIESMII